MGDIFLFINCRDLPSMDGGGNYDFIIIKK